MSFWRLVALLMPLASVSAVRSGSSGTTCCVNQGTNFEAKDLMKMCEFLLSDPYEKSDAERLKNANTCMSRMHFGEMNLPDMKISKRPEDSTGMKEALAAAQAFELANKTVWTKSYYFYDHECPEGMELVTDPVVKSWRCHETDLKLVESLTSRLVGRYETSEFLEDTNLEIARGKKAEKKRQLSNKKLEDFTSRAEKDLDSLAAKQAARKELAQKEAAKVQAEFDKIQAKYG